MIKKYFPAVLLSLISAGAAAQIREADFEMEGYKIISVNISHNGQSAVVGYQATDSDIKERDFAYLNKSKSIASASPFKYAFYTKANGKWGSPDTGNPLNGLIEKRIFPFSPSQNADGSQIYFAADRDLSGNADIYQISKAKGGWGNPEMLPDSINTSAQEQYPAISPDGKMLIFTRLQSDDQSPKDKRCGTIYISRRSATGAWGRAQALPDAVTQGCDASPYIAPDGRTVYFSSIRGDDTKTGFDIYHTESESGDMWYVPRAIDTLVGGSEELSPTFDFDSGKFYFVTRDAKSVKAFAADPANKKSAPKHPDSYCLETELPSDKRPKNSTRYYGRITDADGKPLGCEIRITDAFSSVVTEVFKSDEASGKYDFMLSDTLKRFFDISAPGHSHVLFEVKPDNGLHKQDYELFSVAAFQINVFDSDMFESLDSDVKVTCDGKPAGISPERIASGRYVMDLPLGRKYQVTVSHDLYKDYTMDLDLAQMVVFDEFEEDIELVSEKAKINFHVSGLEEGDVCEIVITDLSTDNQYTTTVTTDKDGNCELHLRKNDRYRVDINKQGYGLYSEEVFLSKETPLDGLDVMAEIPRLLDNARIEIPNVNFETNSYIVDMASYENLNRVVKLLKENPDISIELSAHTDDIGSDLHNNTLSQRRASTVSQYILNKGIDKKRVISKGYGKTQPLVPNTSDENRAKNRRVEIKILKNI